MNGWMDGKWSDGWMDGWMGGWMNGWMDGWMNGWMDGWMNGWMDERMDERMDGWMVRCVDEWVDGWMDGWMDGWRGEVEINSFLNPLFFVYNQDVLRSIFILQQRNSKILLLFYFVKIKYISYLIVFLIFGLTVSVIFSFRSLINLIFL